MGLPDSAHVERPASRRLVGLQTRRLDRSDAREACLLHESDNRQRRPSRPCSPPDGVHASSGLVRSHEDGYEYDAHLGDCRSYAGFSGSPCFVEITFPSLTPQDSIVPAPPELGPLGRLRHLHLLCGMLTWHLERSDNIAETSVYGVVVMMTSDEIWRAPMSPCLVKGRGLAFRTLPSAWNGEAARRVLARSAWSTLACT